MISNGVKFLRDLKFMAIFLFEYPFHPPPFLYCVIIVVFLYSTLVLTQTGNHSISLICSSTPPSQHLPTPHTCSYKTLASVADMPGDWKDRGGFSLQKHEKLNMAYQIQMVWEVIWPLCILYNYHPHLPFFSHSPYSLLFSPCKIKILTIVLCRAILVISSLVPSLSFGIPFVYPRTPYCLLIDKETSFPGCTPTLTPSKSCKENKVLGKSYCLSRWNYNSPFPTPETTRASLQLSW